MQQRRSNRGSMGLLLLFANLYNFGFNRIPPVTLSFIAGNVAVYLRLLGILPRLGRACVSAHHVWYNGDWIRLILASFYHLDDWHLYYNMASFLLKGKSLESSMGSKMFLIVLSAFSVLTSALLVGLDLALAHLLDDPSYIYSCAAGFSGVIFALKVLTTYELPHGVSMVMGIVPVPMKYACWAELLLIQLIVPNASFTGHLAGILVGLLYVKGPLKPLLDGLGNIAFGWPSIQRSGPSYTYHASATGTRYTAPPSQRQNDSEDEELQAAIRASLQETHRFPTPQHNQPYPSHNGQNDPAFQAAIEESLRRGQQTRPNQRDHVPRETFESPPTYSEATNDRLYPSLPRGAEVPSAPPPYDTPVTPPYPIHDSMPKPEDVRQRRLRHFQHT